MARIGNLAGADGEIAFFQQLTELADIHAMRGDAIYIEQYANFPWLDALQLNAGHALEAFQPPFDRVVQHLISVRQIAVAGDAQHEDRLVTE